jgi:polyketide biosynthesis acyl carrier protein
LEIESGLWKLNQERAMTREDIFAIVTRHAREVVPTLQQHCFKPGDSLRELGANSIDRSEIVLMTLESLSLSIPLVETARARNIDELVGVLHAKF